MNTMPVRTIVKELGLSALAREMNLPVTTLHRWMDEDRIPGRSATAHRWRVQQFEAAVARLRARRARTDASRRAGIAAGRAADRAAGPAPGEG